MRVSTSGIASRPIGTLIQKIHSQPMPWTTAPPTSGPLATARPVIALKIPIAAPRRSGGKAALSSASPSGTSSAAPAPCTARAAISQPTSGASAHAGRGGREQPEPGGVEVAPPVAVAERGAGHQQHGEAQVVGVDRPLQLLDARRRGRRRIVLSAVDTTSVSSAAMSEPRRSGRRPSGSCSSSGLSRDVLSWGSFPVETPAAARIQRSAVRSAAPEGSPFANPTNGGAP